MNNPATFKINEMIKPGDINKNGHLTHLVAKDLFIDDAKQVFHAKTGKWLGTIKPGQELIEPAPEETAEPEKPNPDQLSLF